METPTRLAASAFRCASQRHTGKLRRGSMPRWTVSDTIHSNAVLLENPLREQEVMAVTSAAVARMRAPIRCCAKPSPPNGHYAKSFSRSWPWGVILASFLQECCFACQAAVERPLWSRSCGLR